jgi:hypothetical protein
MTQYSYWVSLCRMSFMLSVTIKSTMPNVIYVECYYAECHYAKCRGNHDVNSSKLNRCWEPSSGALPFGQTAKIRMTKHLVLYLCVNCWQTLTLPKEMKFEITLVNSKWLTCIKQLWVKALVNYKSSVKRWFKPYPLLSGANAIITFLSVIYGFS